MTVRALVVLAFSTWPLVAAAQTSPFLPDRLQRDLVNEISGDRAYEHVRHLTHYHRTEGSRDFWAAAEYIREAAEAAGLEDVKLVRQAWDGHGLVLPLRRGVAPRAGAAEARRLRRGRGLDRRQQPDDAHDGGARGRGRGRRGGGLPGQGGQGQGRARLRIACARSRRKPSGSGARSGSSPRRRTGPRPSTPRTRWPGAASLRSQGCRRGQGRHPGDLRGDDLAAPRARGPASRSRPRRRPLKVKVDIESLVPGQGGAGVRRGLDQRAARSTTSRSSSPPTSRRR